MTFLLAWGAVGVRYHRHGDLDVGPAAAGVVFLAITAGSWAASRGRPAA